MLSFMLVCNVNKFRPVTSRVSICLLAVCGGTLQAGAVTRRLFSHSKYGDQNYENRENCDWLIYAHLPELRVRLVFEAFALEDEADCRYDYVDIFDGRDRSSPKIGRFCSNNVSSTFSDLAFKPV